MSFPGNKVFPEELQHSSSKQQPSLKEPGQKPGQQPSPACHSSRPRTGIRQWLRLNNINDMESSFGGTMLVMLHYRDELMCEGGGQQGGWSGWCPLQGNDNQGAYKPRIPNLAFVDCIQDDIFECDVLVRRSTKDVFIWLGYKLTIRSNMPLQAYPFDRQVLRVGVTCREVELVDWHLDSPFPELGPSLMSQPFKITCDLQAWQLVGLNEVACWNTSNQSYVRCLAQLQRRSSFVVLNFMSPMFIIVLLCVSVFGIPASALSDRNGVIITLLLTAVALKLVTVSIAPATGYPTMLDKYMLLGMGFIFAAMVESVIAANVLVVGEENLGMWDAGAWDWDKIFIVVFGAVWCTLNTGFLMFAYLSKDGFRPSWTSCSDTWDNTVTVLKSMEFIYQEPVT
eukprot:gene27614-7251_t